MHERRACLAKLVKNRLTLTSFITASSLGNDPRLTTLRKLALTDSRAFVVYMTRLTSEPQEKSCHTWSRLRSHTATVLALI